MVSGLFFSFYVVFGRQQSYGHRHRVQYAVALELCSDTEHSVRFCALLYTRNDCFVRVVVFPLRNSINVSDVLFLFFLG